MKCFNALILAVLMTCSASGALALEGPQLRGRTAQDRDRIRVRIAEEVRRRLITMPYYDVFDWLEAEVKPGDMVVLRGQVTRPALKSDAERRVRKIESVAKIVNKIEVLPLSSFDNDVRVATYRALFNFNSPLFRYSLGAVPPIHIIVKNGHVTLKGVVANQMDRQLAESIARGVPGSFSVKNELVVERIT